jgi:SHS2 domain-containing protein
MNPHTRGHRTLAHTADLRLEAWGPSRQACVAEAVAGLVGSFTDISTARPERIITADLPTGTDEDTLAAVLDEVIYVLDTEDAIPLDLDIEYRDTGIRIRMPVASVRHLDQLGAAPKAVTLHALRFSSDGHRWSCSAVIDV